MTERPFEFQGQESATAPANYPLNKHSANILLDMTKHPGWQIFLECLEFEARVYKDAALSVGYGPFALEKFRFNQALATNLPRIPRAVIESATELTADDNTLNSIYDALHL